MAACLPVKEDLGWFCYRVVVAVGRSKKRNKLYYKIFRPFASRGLGLYSSTTKSWAEVERFGVENVFWFVLVALAAAEQCRGVFVALGQLVKHISFCFELYIGALVCSHKYQYLVHACRHW